MDYVGDEPLDAAVATETIRGIAKLGRIKYSDHCRYKSMPESDFTYSDLVAVLLNEKAHEPPEYNTTTCQYRYRMKGETVDGDTAAIILVIIDHRTLSVVTVF